MPFVIIGLFALFAVALIPGVAAKVESAVEGISTSLTQGNINVTTNAWVKILLISSVAGGVLWYAETRVARHEGVSGPELPALPGAPAPPTISSAGGFGVQAGPISYGQSTGASTGGFVSPPQYQPSGYSGGGKSSGGPGIRERRAQRQASIAQAKASTARAQRDVVLAKQAAKNAGKGGGGYGDGYDRRRSA